MAVPPRRPPAATVHGGPRFAASRARSAIARGQLALFCQPTVDCHTGQIRGAEALIRWRHPSLGLLRPDQWVPAVESSRLRTRFNLHVLELALAHHDAWTQAGVAVPLSVNVTPGCLADERFVAAVERLFDGRSPAGAIRLEVTEHATVLGGLEMHESVERLRLQGFDFLLDDFGADHSSLSRLARLPLSTLKIDGSLVSEITRCSAHRAITHAAIELAHTLGLNAVAEHVEDLATWSLLQALDCDVIQGYCVSRPIRAEDFPHFSDSYVPEPPQPVRRGRFTSSNRRAGD